MPSACGNGLPVSTDVDVRSTPESAYMSTPPSTNAAENIRPPKRNAGDTGGFEQFVEQTLRWWGRAEAESQAVINAAVDYLG